MRIARWAATSDTGHRRRRNEDSYVARPPLFGVADGMGGAQAGEIASRLAAGVLDEAGGDGSGEARVAELIQEANRRVFQRSTEDAATQGMGTTMTVALVDGSSGSIAFGHVGDSRAYRLRGGELKQLTEDHSLVQELLRSGRLSPEEADVHPQRSVITRAVGTEPDVDVDTFTVDARPGDLYLLCSDGVTDMLADREIRSSLTDGGGDLEQALRNLIQSANSSGGIDNITAILFEIGDAADGDTATFAAAPEQGVADEDTLDELDAVPVIDDADLPAAAEQGTSRRHGAGKGGRWLALALVLLALGAMTAYVVWEFVL